MRSSTRRFLLFIAALPLPHLTCALAPFPPDSETVAEITDPRLKEISGIVESRRFPGHYYVHNDSGDSARVFVIDRTGKVCTEIKLAGATNRDWEDIAIAPGARPNEWDVCVGEIGDNQSRHPSIRIYRFPEPASLDTTTIEITPATYEFRYPGGPQNAEALAVHPVTGNAYILTKNTDGCSDIFRLGAPWPQMGITELAPVGRLRPAAENLGVVTTVTAADIAANGKQLVIRSYVTAFEYRLPETTQRADFESIFKVEPVRIAAPAESQGESICYSLDADFVLTISEGSPTAVHETRLPISRR